MMRVAGLVWHQNPLSLGDTTMSFSRWPPIGTRRRTATRVGRSSAAWPGWRFQPQLQVERLEDRTGSAGLRLVAATPPAPTGVVPESIAAPGVADFFQGALTNNGRLPAQVQPGTGSSLHGRLSLLGPDSGLLVQSDGQAADPTHPLLAQHLAPGTYYIEVQGLGAGTGAYTLTTGFQPATPPFQPLPAQKGAGFAVT